MIPANSTHEPVAIVGIGCRFPGNVNAPAMFWELLCNGVDAIAEIPPDRFPVDRFYDPELGKPGKVATRFGGFVSNIDQFDSLFFRMSPREAERLDPQQRLLLEVSWEALEDAGIVPAATEGISAGVYIGMWINDFERRLLQDPVHTDFHMLTGSGRYTASGRISNFLGWQGPSITIDTACSSSLVAAHLACQALWNGDCELAIAGGANVILTPYVSVAYSQANMLAPDGRCKFGDARANGYVRSEGAGAIVLKRLSDALTNRDPIYAVIAGGAVNNDGKTSGSMGTPGVRGQVDLLRKAYRNAGIAPSCVQYIEAHGTGTRAGDPVELQALAEVIGEGRTKERPCLIGSVKTNIGHTEGAAGIAGLIKVALSLKHRGIPASLHFHDPNPSIPWHSMPLRISPEYCEWPAAAEPRVAGISAFGIAGTNAHLVLQDAEPFQNSATSGSTAYRIEPEDLSPACVLPLSAHTPEALKARASDIHRFLLSDTAAELDAICYRACLRQTHHEFRLAVAGADRKDIAEKLQAYLNDETRQGLSTGRAHSELQHRVAFIFPGQGSQWIGMGRGLLASQPSFRRTLEQCDDALRSWADFSVLEQLRLDEDSPQYRLNDIAVLQPVLLSLEISLAELWRSWGIEPDAVIGHSMGEAGAAYIAGAISLSAAMQIICARSRLMRRTSGKGAMALVELPEEEALKLIEPCRDRVSIAVLNSPGSVVLSGDPGALDAILASLEQAEVFCRKIKVDVASHSVQMDPLKGELIEQLRSLSAQDSKIPIYSTTFCKILRGAECGADHWGANLRNPVRFSETAEKLIADGHDILIELSPHPILLNSLAQIAAHAGAKTIDLASMVREQDENVSMLGSLGRLHAEGYPVDWQRHFPVLKNHVSLPPYPWQRERFWWEPAGWTENLIGWSASDTNDGGSTFPWKRIDAAALGKSQVWEISPDPQRHPYMFDHSWSHNPVLPASAAVELMYMAAAASNNNPVELRNVEFREPMVLEANDRHSRLQITISPESGCSSALCTIHSIRKSDWTNHVTGSIFQEDATNANGRVLPSPEALRALECDSALLYEKLSKIGIQIGVSLRAISRVWFGDNHAFAEVRIPGERRPPETSSVALDTCFQLAAVLSSFLLRRDEPKLDLVPQKLHIPVRLDRYVQHTAFGTNVRIYVCNRQPGSDPGFTVQDAYLLSEGGNILARIEGILQREAPAQLLAQNQRVEGWLYEMQWAPAEEKTLPVAGAPLPWLLLSDKTGVGEHFSGFLENTGRRVLLVFAGDSFVVLGKDRFQVRRDSREDLDRILGLAFGEAPFACEGVVYLWGLDVPPHEAMEADSLESDLSFSCGNALHLFQCTANANWSKRPRLWLVTLGAQSVREPISSIKALAQSPLWGMGRVISEEHPELWGGSIDLEPGCDSATSAKLLSNEILRGTVGKWAAFRGEQRYVPRLAPLRSHSPVPSDIKFRPDCSYLITGGLGGVGLKVSRWMADNGARHLIILGRTPLPDSAESTECFAEKKSRNKIEMLRDLESRVLSVRYISADVSNPAHIQSLMESCRSEIRPPVRGIIHASGISEDSLLIHISTASLLRVLGAKAVGAWLLHNCFPDLDFFILFSSIGSLVGLPGQGSYAAANSFLDQLAHYRQGVGARAQSINWSVWKNTGFAAERGGKEVSDTLVQYGIDGFEAEQGLYALQILLSETVPQVGVIPLSPSCANETAWQGRSKSASVLFQDLIPGKPGIPTFEPTPDRSGLLVQPAETIRERIFSAKSKDRLSLLIQFLQQKVAGVLKMPPSRIEENKPVSSYGLTSLLALELRNNLESSLGMNLSATLTFNYPTLLQMAEFIAGKMDIVLEEHSKTAPAEEPVITQASTILNDIDSISDEEALKALCRKKKL